MTALSVSRLTENVILVHISSFRTVINRTAVPFWGQNTKVLTITGAYSKHNLIWLVKIGQHIGFLSVP